MGRKLLIVAAAVGSLAVSASPAGAKLKVHKVRVHKTRGFLVMSTRASKPHRLSRAQARHATPSVAPVPGVVVHAGYRSECTLPNSQNFYTTDTVEGTGSSNTLVSDCVTDLASPNAPKSTTGASLTWNHSAIIYATVTLCRVYVASGPFNPPNTTATILGSGYTVTFPDGQFVETCTAPAGSSI